MIIEIPEHDESYYEYKEITENPIILDFTGCNNWKTVHICLMMKSKHIFTDTIQCQKNIKITV